MSSIDDLRYRLLADPRLTAMTLLLEAHAGVRSIVESELDDHGVTGSAFDVLIRLGSSPDHRLRMTDLADQSTLSNSGLTRVVDRLLESGFVERVQDDRDRRVFYAVLTPKGLDHLAQLLPSHLETIDEVMMSALSPDEMDAFVGSLRKIRDLTRGEAAPERAATG